MQETTRTIAYVGAALVALVGAVILSPSKRTAPSEFSEVGKLFYDDFSATDAKSLDVLKFNEDTARLKEFGVAFKNGQWVITSHRDYPADGKDRLAKTAASMVGIRREEFKSNNPADYADLGVVNPEETSAEQLKGRGTRITLKTEDGRVLCDYIVGKPVKGHAGDFYVRRPDEKSVYVTKLDIDLSTKFSDWIQADLLEVQADELRQILLQDYSVDEARGVVEQKGQSRLTRDSGTAPWQLADLDPQKEELNTTAVQQMVSALDNLKIIGVRRKPEGLSQELKLAKRAARQDQEAIFEDLEERGFYIASNGTLLSKQGNLAAGTSQGASYTLRFGQIFTGTEMELEAGLGEKNAGKDEKKAEKEDQEKATEQKGRYAFITCSFDESLIGPKPTKPKRPSKAKPKSDDEAETAAPEEKSEAGDKPKEPAKPDENAKPEADDEAKPRANCGDDQAEPAKDAQTADAPGDDKPAKEEPADAKPKEDKPKDEKPADEKPKDQEPKEDPAAAAADAAAEKQYQDALKKYEADLKAYEEKVKAGKEKVKELNNRFADWYYVLSADSFNQLHLGRKELVKPKPQSPATDKPEQDSEGGEAAKKPAVQKEPAPASPEAPEKAQDTDDKPDSAAKEAASPESPAPKESPARPE